MKRSVTLGLEMLRVDGMYPSSFAWEQSNDLYKDPIISGLIGARKCGHEGNRCLAAWLDSAHPSGTAYWELRTPIDLTAIAGTEKKIKKITCKSQYDWNFGASGFIHSAIVLYGDGTMLWDSGAVPSKEAPDWVENTFSLDIDVGGFTGLDVRVVQWGTIYLPIPIGTHLAKAILTIEYDAEVPPPTYDVTLIVKNKETGAPIGGASVKLMVGDVVHDYGSTGADGRLVLTRVEARGYTLRVTAGGYDDYSEAYTVTGPMETMIHLIPKEFVLPEWWWLPVLGVGGLLVAYIFFAPRAPPVYVVRE